MEVSRQEGNPMSYSNSDMHRTCPYCGDPNAEADWVDVGVGFEQCTPFFCWNCEACQIGPYDKTYETQMTDEERKTGWYMPSRAYLTSAPMCNGLPVDHETAKELYQLDLLDKKDNL
jgi:hypothetical protein